MLFTKSALIALIFVCNSCAYKQCPSAMQEGSTDHLWGWNGKTSACFLCNRVK